MRAWPKRQIRMHAAFAVLLSAVVGACASVFGPPWLAGLGLGVGAAYFVLATRRFRARRRLSRDAFPEAWRAVLERRVPFWQRLEPAGQRRFEDDIRFFLAEQRIVASHGARVDDETRVLIAASAAMLAHGLPDWEWPNLRDIVVYPRAFSESYSVEGRGEIAGMVHSHGPILLSQKDLKHGFARAKDGHNVALHELAHVMDFEDGRADGVPADLDWLATAPWVEAVASRLRKLRKRRYPKVLRDYAGTNEAELFAVAVEAFFERPEELRAKDAELYAMLAEHFNQRPASR